MKESTMLIDAGYDRPLSRISDDAGRIESLGFFEGLWVSDTNNDPFLLSSLALGATDRIQVGTNIAVAFARSPFTVAQTAWNLASLSKGRFWLGLGTQVKPHIEKRFSMTWPESPVTAMAEYLELLRHLFGCFASGARPSFRGKYYRCTLNSPVFTPEAHTYQAPKLGIAAVGPSMTRLAGRLADTVFLHPFTHLEYLRGTSLPELEVGRAERSGELAGLELVGSVFTVPTDTAHSEAIEGRVRERVAFYASTPNYVQVLASLGLEDLHSDLHALSRQGRWREMAEILPESLMEQCAVRAPLSGLVQAVRDRFQGIYDRAVIDPGPWLDLKSR